MPSDSASSPEPQTPEPRGEEADEVLSAAAGGLTIPQQEALQAQVVRLQTRLEALECAPSPVSGPPPSWLPSSTVGYLEELKENRGVYRRLRDYQEKLLDTEAKIEHLHMVLSQRTRRVITLEQLMRERTREILSLQGQTADLAQASAMYTSTGETSYVDAILERDGYRDDFRELRQELLDVERDVAHHTNLWGRVTGHDGNVMVMTPHKGGPPRRSDPGPCFHSISPGGRGFEGDPGAVENLIPYCSPQAKASPDLGEGPCLSAAASAPACAAPGVGGAG